MRLCVITVLLTTTERALRLVPSLAYTPSELDGVFESLELNKDDNVRTEPNLPQPDKATNYKENRFGESYDADEESGVDDEAEPDGTESAQINDYPEDEPSATKSTADKASHDPDSVHDKTSNGCRFPHFAPTRLPPDGAPIFSSVDLRAVLLRGKADFSWMGGIDNVIMTMTEAKVKVALERAKARKAARENEGNGEGPSRGNGRG